MRVYYNEFEPYAAAWLRNNMKAGLIPYGDVDERSIADVQPDDLIGYDSCHFFAGIGIWPYALRPSPRPVARRPACVDRFLSVPRVLCRRQAPWLRRSPPPLA